MAQQLGSFEKVLRVGEGRRLRRLAEQAAYIGTLEPEFEQLSDADLAAKTVDFRRRLENGESLDDLLFEAFAAIREAYKRTMDVRLFDVQLMGGIVLHEGDIAEMKTGEGKTFVATQALYLNALAGRGVHLVTVNDYLAKRDREWTLPVFEALGMRTASLENMMPFGPRKEAYESDVTYGTNSEFGFDYLRDNMSVSLDGLVQRGHAYAIVDEVDSILVDEARTPLIISGEPETAAQIYYDFARVVPQLVAHRSSAGDPKGAAEAAGADYEFDEKHKTVAVTEQGVAKVERALRMDNLYAPQNSQLVNHLVQALKAQSLYHNDIEYVLQDGEVKIVDEFTGRIMEGRRWSEGLHQAVEAREGVRIQEEHQPLATITLQNSCRLYEKLAGMTGTAKTEEKEFVEIYNLNVVEIPTNVPVVRDDKNDLIFKTKDAKFEAVARDLKERYEKGQPVLVGTIAVETSEYLSQVLTRAGVPHNVLNAKEHAREAEIIKDAGQPRAVTIATNMAGRGVDIKLGEVMRKNVLKYDDVMNRHRGRIYEQRTQVLEGEDMREQVVAWIEEVVDRVVSQFTAEDYPEQWDLEGLVGAMAALYGTDVTVEELRDEVELTRESLLEEFTQDALDEYAAKEEEIGPNPETELPLMRDLERFVILQVVDTRWREHLENMDYLREGVHLRAMAQKDPLVEYTSEGEKMFSELGAAIREDVVLTLFHAEVQPADAEELQRIEQAQRLQYEHEQSAGADVINQALGGPSSVSTPVGSGNGGNPRPAGRNEQETVGRQHP